MKEQKTLSVFVDESGDFGDYLNYSPYYIVSLVFHDQSVDISANINKLNEMLSNFENPKRAIHAGPLIRKEGDYENYDRAIRQRIFNYLFNFAKRTEFSYKTIVVEKRQKDGILDVISEISKQMSRFFDDNNSFFADYDIINIYI